MATILTHLRLNQNLLDYGFQLDPQFFALGCIAPALDSSARMRTHYIDANNCIQPETFYQQVIAGQQVDQQQLAFLLGYYVHLVADVEWYAQVIQPLSHEMNIRDQDAIAQRLYDEMRPDQLYWDQQYRAQFPDAGFMDVFDLDVAALRLPALVDASALGAYLKEIETLYRQPVALRQDALLDQFDVDAYLECTTRSLIPLLQDKGISCPIPHPLWASDIRSVS
jgi:hypothetical protein